MRREQVVQQIYQRNVAVVKNYVSPENLTGQKKNVDNRERNVQRPEESGKFRKIGKEIKIKK